MCGAGEIVGIPSGNYTRSKKNAFYGTEAIKFLRADSELRNNKADLWGKVVGGKNIFQNGQMDVVIALWNENHIIQFLRLEEVGSDFTSAGIIVSIDPNQREINQPACLFGQNPNSIFGSSVVTVPTTVRLY
ncbi:MAG: DUF6979 family protein [Leptospirillum sp.]